MDAEVKAAFLKLIETGTEIAPDVMHDLLLWAKVCPFIALFLTFLFMFICFIFFKKYNSIEVVTDLKDFMFVGYVVSGVCSLFSCTLFVFFCIKAFQAHLTPYAYLIDLIK